MKRQITYNVRKIKWISSFSTVTFIHENIVIKIYRMLKKKSFESVILCPAKLLPKCNGEIKLFTGLRGHKNLLYKYIFGKNS